MEASAYMRVGSIASFVSLAVLANMLIVASSSGSSGVEYNAVTAVLLMELTKLGISVVLWDKTTGLSTWNLRDYVKYAVPGLCYFVANSANVVALALLNPVIFHIIGSLKIISTALFWKLLFNKHITQVQWCAMALIVVSILLTKIKVMFVPLGDDSTSFAGVLLVLLTSLLSGFSSVFTEKMLKSDKTPLAFKNIQLYSWGVLFSLAGLLVSSTEQHPFAGFNIYIALWVLLMACQGLSISLIMKYLTSIHKCFASIAVLYINAVLGSLFFSLEMDAGVYLGLVVFSIAFFLYAGPHNTFQPSKPSLA